MTVSTTARTRAGRLLLVARRDLARHAVELLESKEEALQRERVRLEGHATRAETEWVRRCREAAEALLRARMLGASDEIDDLIDRGSALADVTTHWQTSMGIVYPGQVDCASGEAPTLASTAALGPAVEAHRRSLEAAATHAATSAAVRRLDAALAATRRRRRAIEQRLEPRLESALHELDLHLDELDREEAVRVHVATSSSTNSQGTRRTC